MNSATNTDCMFTDEAEHRVSRYVLQSEKRRHISGNNPEWLIPHMDRTMNMYERNKNYPSVTFWSLWNEAGNGYNSYQTYLYLKNKEINNMNRPVNYERALWEWNTDIYVPQYPSAEWLEEDRT